jgi:hypothetical protein
MPRAPEVVVPLPSPRSLAPRATKVRGSWMLSSRRALREAGLLDAYVSYLPPEVDGVLRAPSPAEWLPMEVALAHYTACDKLDLPTTQLVTMGATAVRFGHAKVIDVVAKLVTGAGVATPWTVFEHAQRFWDRTFVGGAVGVARLGPKEAQIEVAGWPCAAFRYTRIACRGVLSGTAEVFCEKAYVREVESLCTPLSLGYRIGWI